MSTDAIKHPVVFLIGLHGSGKTTVGKHLQDHHGYRHLSLGDLGRLARARRSPEDCSLRLMCLLAGQTPDRPLRPELVTELLVNIDRMRLASPVSVDGFPSEPHHIDLMPERSVLVHLNVADHVRMARLIERSSNGPRKWTPGQHSARDERLGAVLAHARGIVVSVDADADSKTVVGQVLVGVENRDVPIGIHR